ncbi:capsular exopolysaccharide family [Microbacterium sp. cf046]|uniref:polysaccharide biosynthesis tyrosine autokinase n=1 Tax=Microbacterium sp. cf046 TaxID=1761803 RepID=UPI0008ECF164|nr:polysaccharide biosynthesis tyrosine autokinase [Microbacterium sp. cf046]SFR90889.1 capsular exopolysaccharide family [Microbacterium sp. cf046]
MELRDYLRGIRRHFLAILIMTAVGVGVAYAWTLVQNPVYEASADGIIQAQNTTEGQTSLSGDAMAQQMVETYLEMASWQDVADAAIQKLGLQITADQAFARIVVVNPANTAILRVTAQGSSPEDAVALAEAWIQALATVIDDYEGDGTQGTAPLTITVASSASLPTTPVFPDLSTSLIVGGVLGFGFGIAFALIRTVSDRRIRSADEVEARTNIPVVGTIPTAEALGGESRLFDPTAAGPKGTGFAVSEALRSLRTNLQFMDVDNPPRTIVVTSPLPGDGKSTIACNLALTLAAGGKPVVLVDGDLRRSTVAASMGLPGGAGLSDVLSGRAELADVLQRTPRSPNLYVLTAGSVPPNPSEVLGSGRMRKLLADLAVHATVIVDAPPLLPVTDGAVLTHQADGALVVVSLAKTTYDLLEKSLDTLQKSNGRALGVVLNKAPLKGMDASPYSYEYRREYGKAAKADAAPAVRDDHPADANLNALFGSPEAELAEERRPRARRA